MKVPFDLEWALREAQYFFICEACGQVVDARDPAERLYHDIEDHPPKPSKEGSLVKRGRSA